jgi:hypothetical protein
MVFDGCGMMGFGMMSGFMGWGGFGLLSLVALAIVFWAVGDIMRRKMETGMRIGWLLVALVGYFLPLSVLGAIAYAVWGRK